MHLVVVAFYWEWLSGAGGGKNSPITLALASLDDLGQVTPPFLHLSLPICTVLSGRGTIGLKGSY